MKHWDYSRPWYHGSPLKLKTLRKGSTITQDRDLARVFSHKPTLVSISESGIKHDGKETGFLYQTSENIKGNDVYPHPHSSMQEGKEWLTTRELRVELLGATKILEEERLTEEEIAKLKKIIESRRKLSRD